MAKAEIYMGESGGLDIEDKIGVVIENTSPYTITKNYKILIFIDSESSAQDLSSYIKLNSQNLPASASYGTIQADIRYYNYIIFYNLKSGDIISTTSQKWRAVLFGLN